MKLDFEKYLSDVKLNKKRNFSKRSIESYSRNVPEYLRDKFSVNLYSISEPKEAQDLLDRLNKNPNFLRDDTVGKHMYSCGIKRYIEFLTWLQMQ